MSKKGTFSYPEIDTIATGKNLRILCKEKNISVRALQDTFRIASNQAIYEWFNGKSMPSLDNLFALSVLLEVPMDDILIRKGVDYRSGTDREQG